MNSPAPTHYSMITDTQSPNQLQVMSSPNVIQATPQQHQTTEDFGILLRQLTSIAVSPEALRDLTRAQELQQVVQAMLQKHSVHESLFVATDEQIRALHRRHDSIMSMLQQFEHQQDGRWKTYASHDELQQASIPCRCLVVGGLVGLASLSQHMDSGGWWTMGLWSRPWPWLLASSQW